MPITIESSDIEWVNKNRHFIQLVLEIVRSTKRVNCKTLRQQIEYNIRQSVGFGLYKCGACEHWFTRKQMSKDRTRKSGIRPTCKACDAFRRNEYYWKNPRKCRAQRRRSYRQLRALRGVR